MRHSILNLHKQLGTTFVYVTHDQTEAMTMGDHIVLFNEGHIVQQGSPKEMYTNPNHIFVAGFIEIPRPILLQQISAMSASARKIYRLSGIFPRKRKRELNWREQLMSLSQWAAIFSMMLRRN